MIKDVMRAEIVRLVRQLARDAGGKVPGQVRFVSETGIQPHIWRGKFWRTWGDVLAEAGFAANEWTAAISEEIIFRAVGELAGRQGKFPKLVDLQFERGRNPDFPSPKTMTRNRTMRELAQGVRSYAENGGDTALVALCDEYLSSAPTPTNYQGQSSRISPVGHVYMIRYGKDYKIGRTASLSRRSREVQIELPEATDLIHSISTDDPAGIEAYWHRRFQEYRGSGEWFRLPPSAVSAFKKWTKIV
jgi:hypothetical protein